MKTKILTIDGKSKGEISLPKEFSAPVREDVVAKVVEAKKHWQAYGPNPLAGMQYSASGKLIHRRHVWKSQYGRGMSRIPRKKMMRRGGQFRWEGATSPNTRGGRKAHPPKAKLMSNDLKVNKKELKLAFASALSATTDAKYIKKKYSSLKDVKIENIPFVIESKFVELKTKDRLATLRSILDGMLNVAVKKKSIRAGKGKLRGRKHKSNAGILVVIGNKENVKARLFDVKRVNELSVMDLANGGVGRLVIYTENSIKDLENKFQEKKE